ncbi:sensor histidine kinase [Microbacterium sp. A196]|uniref:sensor histidine kinase n=1 Tax=unclassified Microbacterium TaxID=2609290 RepID=UPI003FCF632D
MQSPREAERLSRLSVRAAGPQRLDVVLVVVLAVVTILEASLRRDLAWPVATVAVTVVALSALPWRRTHPLPVVAATTALSIAFEIAQELSGVPTGGVVTMFALLAVPYALFRWGSTRARAIGGPILAAGVVISIALSGARLFEAESIAGAVAGVAFVGGACLIGALRRERVTSRARELAAVRAQEREALARDLHDTVAHHASAIVIRAQVARLAPSDSARVTESLEIIEREASAVMEDMRALVGVLRAEYAPPPGLSDLRALATSGPPRVTVEIASLTATPDIVSATLFRIAQEAVTNARRHATGATSIDLSLTTAHGTAQLTVIDDGRAAPSGGVGTGHGLQGMDERAALLGGTVKTGPRPGGGWMLRATIPLRGAR